MVGALSCHSLDSEPVSRLKRAVGRLDSKPSAATSRHDASGLLDIFQHLFAKGLRAGKLLLVAQAPEEYYFHFSGGQLLGEIEKVRFDGELVAVKGGTDADVCDGPVDSWA